MRVLGVGLSGIERNLAALDRTTERLARTAPFGDVPSEMVALIEAERGVSASARVIRAAEEAIGTLLDRMA